MQATIIKIKESINDFIDSLRPLMFVCVFVYINFSSNETCVFDRLAPMRLYTLSKRHFVLVFVVFLICFGVTVFIGIAGMC